VLVPTQDVAALGVALTALMAEDARRRSLAAAGRAHVERVYSEHAMVERHLDIYRRGRAALTDNRSVIRFHISLRIAGKNHGDPKVTAKE
jgi:hypothetical protein